MSDLADRLYLRVLVIRCQAGDRGAFGELVKQFQPRLRGFLAKMLPPGHGVDDAAQDVWLDVFRDLPALADPAAFVPWLYRVARNRAVRAARRRRARPVEPIGGADVPADAGHDADFGPEDAAAVHAALDRLAPEHREVLLLRFLEDMSYDDIAAAVGCPVGTVRSRLHHAKRALRAFLQPTLESDRK